MRLLIILIGLLLLALPVFAQKEIKGRALDGSTRDPVVSATVTLHPVGSPEILAHTETGDDGTFVLRANAMPDSVEIAIGSITIKTQYKRVKSDTGFVEFLTEEKKTELKEVVVKAQKIEQAGDTISYSVSSFMGITDHNINDLLKKLPGIQLTPSGEILYQNKAISKFYVDGMDILQGKYGTITGNLDAVQVVTVQVIENHQPIKALKGMEIPDAAAINLKLKESARGAFFASAQVGIGAPDILLSNELVGMRFTRTQQNMIVYKGDNTGRDVAQELVPFYDDSRKMGSAFLSVQMPSLPNIKEQRYLYNDAHTVSLNDLRIVGKGFALAGNLNFIQDRQKNHSYSRQEVILQNSETIRIEEDIDASLLKRRLEGGLTLEKNTANYYLSNKLRMQTKWDSRNSDALPTSAEPVSQHLKLPEIQIGNDFELMRKKGKRHFRMGAFAGYAVQRPSLRVAPSIFAPLFADVQHRDSLLTQDVSYHHLATQAFVSAGRQGKVDIRYSATVFANHHLLQSNLYSGLERLPLTADSLRNDFRRNEVGVKSSVGFVFNFSPKFRPDISLPLTYSRVNRHYKTRGSNKNSNHLLFSPVFSVLCPITSRFSLQSNFSYSMRMGGISEDYLSYIMTTYREMNRNDGVQSETQEFLGLVVADYKNPSTTLFTSARFSYSNTRNNLLRDTRYIGLLSSVASIHRPNTTRLYSAKCTLGKSIYAIHSDVKMSADYSESLSCAMNQGEVSDIRNRSLSASPSIITNIGKFMVIKCDARYSHNHCKIGDEEMPAINLLTQNISVSVIPTKRLTLIVSANYYYNSQLKSSSHSSWFADAGLKYRFKKATLSLDWSNILDTREFSMFSYSNADSYYSTYKLRPTEVLLRVSFKLF